MHLSKRTVTTLSLAIIATGLGHAQTLSYNATCDNAFEAYLSDSASVAGTLFASGNNWGATYSGSTSVAAGTRYLHVKAIDGGAPAAFVGDFTLSDGRLFGNGTATLLTNTTDWIGELSLGSGALPLTDLGANGVSPWGLHSSISKDAHWIWTSTYHSTIWLTAEIQAVPEPATIAGIAVGLAALVRRRRVR